MQSWLCASQQRAVETCLESRKVYPIHLQIGTLSSGDGREDLCGDHRSFTPSVSMKPNSHVKSRPGDDSFPMCLRNTSAVQIPSIWFTAGDSEDPTVRSFNPSFHRTALLPPPSAPLYLLAYATLPSATNIRTTFPTLPSKLPFPIRNSPSKAGAKHTRKQRPKAHATPIPKLL
ncbi:hypothetical protein Q7P36_007572 [Cladosporium allicinum]